MAGGGSIKARAVAMGKLNSLIKFVVVNANVLLFLGGVGIIAVVSLVLTADLTKLAEVCTMPCVVSP